nr:MAG TPA: hypothetical protein [Caudoviricetes sp.]
MILVWIYILVLPLCIWLYKVANDFVPVKKGALLFLSIWFLFPFFLLYLLTSLISKYVSTFRQKR